jgi:hypothetical protein
MPDRKQELVSFLKRNGGIARFSAILKAGFHSDSLESLLKEGQVEKIARGIYKLTGRNHAFEKYADFVAVSI